MLCLLCSELSADVDSVVAALPESSYKARDDHLPYLIFLWYVAWNSVTDVADAACAVKVESSWIKIPRKPGLLEDWESNVVLCRVSDKDYQEFSLKELKVKLKVVFHRDIWV